jgi:hypothetical protein
MPSKPPKETFEGFVIKHQYLLLFWAALGAFTLYMLDFFIKIEQNQQQLTDLINNLLKYNVTNASFVQAQYQYSNLVSTTFDRVMFGIGTFAAFLLFFLVALVILLNGFEYVNNQFRLKAKEKDMGFGFGGDFLLVLFFSMFFFLLNLCIAIYALKKFSDFIPLIEMVSLTILLTVLAGILILKRVRKREIETMPTLFKFIDDAEE